MFNGQTPLQTVREFERQNAEKVPPNDRPLFHLTPMVGWANDPNGFCYYGGQYHLFYQYHPYSTVWGPMHWGHATSTDLLHWNYRPAALAPDTAADAGGCFSGSAVETPDGRLLLMYTGVEPQAAGCKDVQAQCIAVGDGVNFKKVQQNPVISAADLPEGYSVHDFRDPKIWREGNQYYCVVANRHKTRQGSILLFESPVDNPLHWNFVTELDASNDEYGKMWECPDFFPLDGAQVLLTSPQEMQATADGEFHAGFGTVALLGSYDNETHTFTRKSIQPIDYGHDFYAPQTVLTPDGRRVAVGWLENWETCSGSRRNSAWFGRMSLPRELNVREGRLYQNPIRELQTLWRDTVTKQTVLDGETSWPDIGGRTVDVSVTLDTANSACRAFRLRLAQNETLYTEILCDLERDTMLFDRSHSGSRRDIPHNRMLKAAPKAGKLTLRFVLDKDSVELFLNDGERSLTSLLETPLEAEQISFYSDALLPITVEKHTLAL